MSEELSMTRITCSICIDEINDACYDTKCGHKFHTTCLKIWLEKANKCPLCREKIPVDTSIFPHYTGINNQEDFSNRDLPFHHNDIRIEQSRLRIFRSTTQRLDEMERDADMYIQHRENRISSSLGLTENIQSDIASILSSNPFEDFMGLLISPRAVVQDDIDTVIHTLSTITDRDLEFMGMNTSRSPLDFITGEINVSPPRPRIIGNAFHHLLSSYYQVNTMNEIRELTGNLDVDSDSDDTNLPDL